MRPGSKKKPFLQPLVLSNSSSSPPSTLHSLEVTDGDLVLGRNGLIAACTKRTSLLDSLRDELALDSAATTCLSPEESELGPRKGFKIFLQDLEPVKGVGAGASGVVQKVRHRPSGQLLVLKVINCNLQAESTRKQVFGELRALRSCRHCNIVKYHESFYDNGAVTIAMEYMDRGSLADVFRTFPHIPEHFLAMILAQVLKGLQYLHHDKHVVHRDIKPSNLLINAWAEVKLSDFGVSGQLTQSIADCSSWVGTMTYMSPERLKAASYSYASDIWSLGLVAAEGALGQFPYSIKPGHAPDFWQLLDKITNDKPLPLQLTDASSDLQDFVACCLHKEPGERWTAAQLLMHPFINQHVSSSSTTRLKDEFAAVIGPRMSSPCAR